MNISTEAEKPLSTEALFKKGPHIHRPFRVLKGALFVTLTRNEV